MCRVGFSSPDMIDTVSSVAVVAVVVTAVSVEDPSTTGENDGHASRLEEILV